MAHRQFTDSSGLTWDVWDVHPTTASQTLAALSRQGGDASLTPCHAVAPGLAAGWLCFEQGPETILVGKSGRHVEFGKIGQPRLGTLALGDIGQDAHQLGNPVLGDQTGRQLDRRARLAAAAGDRTDRFDARAAAEQRTISLLPIGVA